MLQVNLKRYGNCFTDLKTVSKLPETQILTDLGQLQTQELKKETEIDSRTLEGTLVLCWMTSEGRLDGPQIFGSDGT